MSFNRILFNLVSKVRHSLRPLSVPSEIHIYGRERKKNLFGSIFLSLSFSFFVSINESQTVAFLPRLSSLDRLVSFGLQKELSRSIGIVKKLAIFSHGIQYMCYRMLIISLFFSLSPYHQPLPLPVTQPIFFCFDFVVVVRAIS